MEAANRGASEAGGHGLIAADDLELFEFADEPQQAFEILKKSLAAHAGAAQPGDMPAIACSCDPHTHGMATVDGLVTECCAKAAAPPSG
jgi:hypothetical protein